MPLDSFFLSAVNRELSEKIIGAKIEKVQQPGRNIILLSIRGQESMRLKFSMVAGSARINATTSEYENPVEPPMFCMLLRKHLVGARILSISQPGMDRVLDFELLAPGMFGDGETRHLIAEVAGRFSNLILTDNDGIITDCLNRIGSLSEKRAVLPGLHYRPMPSQDKIDLTQHDFRPLFLSASDDISLERWLVSHFLGISPLIAREMAWRAYSRTDVMKSEALDIDGGNAFFRELDKFLEFIKSGNFSPYMIVSPDGSPLDFTYMPVLQYGPSYSLIQKDSFSQLLEDFYKKRDTEDAMRTRTSALMKSIKKKRDRLAKKLSIQRDELRATENRDRLREYGDIITSNMHTMRKGMEKLHALDYYSADGIECDIPLDPLKTPQQNAAKYYKEYAKAKSAEKHLTAQISSGESELEYLDSVIEELMRASSTAEVSEIRAELSLGGYIRENSSSKKQKVKSPGPARFSSSSGFDILAGRNNTQNDILTLKTARKNDIWLHTQKLHGSHVIIVCNGSEPDENTILEAAGIAAYMSEGKYSTNVPVDYSQVRYVKKPSGAKPGMVVYTNYKTVFVTPDEKSVDKLRLIK